MFYSTSIFYRCVPDTVPSVATATAETFLQSSGTQSLFEEIVADVEASWKEIIYMSLVALGLSIIMVILFRFLAGVIVYVIITIIALAAILGPAATWYKIQQKCIQNTVENIKFFSGTFGTSKSEILTSKVMTMSLQLQQQQQIRRRQKSKEKSTTQPKKSYPRI